MARAEVVQHHTNAQGLDLVQNRKRAVAIGHDRDFCQLDLKATRRQAGLEQDLLEGAWQVGMSELKRSDVDRHLRFVLPGHCVGAGLPQHPLAERKHQAVFLGEGNEV